MPQEIIQQTDQEIIEDPTINQWVASTHPTSAERAVAHGFWKDLASDMQTYAQAYNTQRRAETHFAFEQDGHQLNINYGEHQLRVLFDERTGKLIYQFLTPKLASFDRESHGVTAQGEVFVDIQSSSSKLTSSPHIHLDVTLADGSVWASHNQLVQYLLQKLISPSFDDDRFTEPELRN